MSKMEEADLILSKISPEALCVAGELHDEACRDIALALATAERRGYDLAIEKLRSGHYCDSRVPCLAGAYSDWLEANRPDDVK